jgi:DHA1 family bicyclomycin/chloramphenicol resistance-like MFS transporter
MLKPESWSLTLLLGALAGMTALAIDMSLPALPTLTRELAASPQSVQLTLNLFILGYAAGQLIYGPLSDRFGRRRMLLTGLTVYTIAGFACALAPSIEVLIAARLVQGFGACVGPVLGRAVVRDHMTGRRAAQTLSYITLTMALAPLIAPTIGGFLLSRLGWPAIFVFFGTFGLALLGATWLGFGESLKQPDLQALRLSRLLSNYKAFFTNRLCVGYAFVNGFVFAGLFAFLSGSPYVLIEVYGVPSSRFGLYFAWSACGVILGAFTNSRVVHHFAGDRVLRFGLGVLTAAGATLLLLCWTRWGGPLAMMVPIMAYLFGQGLIMPNATVAAMEPLPHMAGMGASLLGAIQMGGGSFSGLAVAALYNGTPMAMGGTIAAMAVGASLSYYGLIRRRSA